MEVYGEGEEFERAVKELSQHKIPSKYRNIFKFEHTFPDFKGQPVLGDKNERVAVGLEEIRAYLQKGQGGNK